MFRNTCLAVVAAVLLIVQNVSAQNQISQFQWKDAEELNNMETQSEMADRFFWAGNLELSQEIFNKLATDYHASTPLYHQNAALCALAAGNNDEAVRRLIIATQQIETFHNPELEKAAVGKFKKEMIKFYMGDPYEQAFRYMIMALIFLDKGDFDNALASCKSGLLADSDAAENTYQSDLTFLHLLEAKCHLLRGDNDTANDIFKAAAESYRSTHPSVRDLYSQRLDEVAMLKMTAKERKKLGRKDSEGEITGKINQLDSQIQEASKSINVDSAIGVLGTGDYNTLIIVPRGKAPKKAKRGEEGNLVVFEESTIPEADTTILCDGKKIEGGYKEIASVNFQATTRGGRRMDAILRGQVAFKKTTKGVGSVLAEVGNNVGGVYGMGIALAGAIVQGVGSQISAEADTRCWGSLPNEYVIHALELEPGQHTISISQYIYLEKRNPREVTFDVKTSDCKVVFVPPPPAGLYSDAAVDSKRRVRTKQAAEGSTVVLMPPPLGLKHIERFPCPKDMKSSSAFSPDRRSLCRLAKSQLGIENVTCVEITHQQAFARDPETLKKGPLAFQFQLVDLSLEPGPGKKEQKYGAKFRFAIIDTATGKCLSEEVASSSRIKTHKDKTLTCADIFASCFEDAMKKYIAGGKLKSAIAVAGK